MHDLRVMRGRRRGGHACSAPAEVSQALGITGAHDGLPLDGPPFELHARPHPVAVVAGPRVGVSQAEHLPWRYVLEGSPFLSRGRRRA